MSLITNDKHLRSTNVFKAGPAQTAPYRGRRSKSSLAYAQFAVGQIDPGLGSRGRLASLVLLHRDEHGALMQAPVSQRSNCLVAFRSTNLIVITSRAAPDAVPRRKRRSSCALVPLVTRRQSAWRQWRTEQEAPPARGSKVVTLTAQAQAPSGPVVLVML
jgi:hypothetical protein